MSLRSERTGLSCLRHTNTCRWRPGLVGFATTLSVVVRGDGLKGAIFTTNIDGTIVNQNQYAAKTDVYLDGGPGPHAPLTAASLPDGIYVFQVTDPSGKALLSSDAASYRQFTVLGGRI